MLYTMKRIENIIKNKELALKIFNALKARDISSLSDSEREQILDVVHGDSAIMFYHKEENVILVTLGNGDEIQNVDYVADILLIRQYRDDLIISSGCGTLNLDNNYDLISFTFTAGISIIIDFWNIDYINEYQGTYIQDDDIFYEDFYHRYKKEA